MKLKVRISRSHFLGEESTSIEYSLLQSFWIILQFYFYLMIKMHDIICFQFAHVFIICIFYEVAKQWNIFCS